MKVCLFLMLVALMSGTLISADSTTVKSDTTPRKMHPVDINADYLRSKINSSFSPLSILTADQLAALGSWQVSDAIVQLPSAYVKNYGGLNALKTISLRATTSQQTLVLLDGIRIASSATGTVDLSAVPLVFFDEIEMSSGGMSAQYGGGAMAGVVSLTTNSTLTNSTSKKTASLSLLGGSFGDRKLSLSGSFSFFGVRWNLGGDYVASDGNYPFPSSEFGNTIILERKNSDFRNIGLTLSGVFDVSAWKISNRLFVRSTSRGTPGAVLQGKVEQLSAHLYEDDILFLNTSTRKIFDNSLLSIAGSARYNNLKFRDPDALYRGPNGADDLYSTREAMLTIKNENYSTDYKTTFNVEWTFAEMRGNSFQPDVGKKVQRNAVSFAGSVEKEWKLDSSLVLSTQAQARYDVNSNTNNAFTPYFGLLLHNHDYPIRLRGTCSYNFRLPSYNELYYFNYGTANLQPERALSFNLGGIWQPDAYLSAEVTGFLINTRDQILAVPISPISWSARNIGQVFSRGIECSASGQLFDKHLNLRVSYTRQIATDKTYNSLTYNKILPAIPQELFSASFVLRLGETTFGGNMNYSSFRYLTADNVPESLLPSYGLLNGFVEHTLNIFSTNCVFRAECNNLLNSNYSVVVNYPLPGRSFRIGLRLKFSDKE